MCHIDKVDIQICTSESPLYAIAGMEPRYCMRAGRRAPWCQYVEVDSGSSEFYAPLNAYPPGSVFVGFPEPVLRGVLESRTLPWWAVDTPILARHGCVHWREWGYGWPVVSRQRVEQTGVSPSGATIVLKESSRILWTGAVTNAGLCGVAGLVVWCAVQTAQSHIRVRNRLCRHCAYPMTSGCTRCSECGSAYQW